MKASIFMRRWIPGRILQRRKRIRGGGGRLRWGCEAGRSVRGPAEDAEDRRQATDLILVLVNEILTKNAGQ